jgi:hypothetical protein
MTLTFEIRKREDPRHAADAEFFAGVMDGLPDNPGMGHNETAFLENNVACVFSLALRPHFVPPLLITSVAVGPFDAHEGQDLSLNERRESLAGVNRNRATPEAVWVIHVRPSVGQGCARTSWSAAPFSCSAARSGDKGAEIRTSVVLATLRPRAEKTITGLER